MFVWWFARISAAEAHKSSPIHKKNGSPDSSVTRAGWVRVGTEGVADSRKPKSSAGRAMRRKTLHARLTTGFFTVKIGLKSVT
jgi:hypothetical protein